MREKRREEGGGRREGDREEGGGRREGDREEGRRLSIINKVPLSKVLGDSQ